MFITERITLIIDGLNLAHHLTHLQPGQTLSIDDVFRLTVYLAHYARSAQPPVIIELCLDPLPIETELPNLPWVRCLVAPAHNSADDLLRERFRFHHHRGAANWVITNDEEIRDNVTEEGGQCLLVYDFVRRAGKSPVFRQPNEFKTVRMRRAAPSTPKHPELDWDRLAALSTITTTPEPQAPDCNETWLPNEAPAAEETGSIPDVAPEPAAAPLPPEPSYRLAFEKWPLEKGLLFLLDAFCARHRQDEEWQIYQSLTGDEIRLIDLLDLAKLLQQRCGGEPNFAREGALLKRVRLALIQAEDFRLDLSEIAARTGLPTNGLQGRIREKAPPWIEIHRP